LETDVTIREALILILGEAPPSAKFDRQSVAQQLIDWFERDPDPGIHGATEWVLRQWGQSQEIATVNNKLATGVAEGNREWFVTKTETNQHTFAMLPGPVEFMMGSPSDAPDRAQNESLHRVRIDRTVAMATTEVTVQQFQEFLRSTPGFDHSYDPTKSAEANCPQTSVIWFEAAAYCRWLSEQEDIPEDQMCYPPINEIKLGMKLPADYLSRTGYRLPSEAEWEYACRAQTITERYYGQADELLVEYGASKDKTNPVGMVKPNRFGLFDMLGNVWEWCQDPSGDYDNQSGTVTLDREFDTLCEDRFSRMFRGGSFDNPPGYFRSAFRPNDKPANRNNYMGFRPCRTYPENP
jgi:formylglycine-generating enzyme required for sulfatase activity